MVIRVEKRSNPKNVRHGCNRGVQCNEWRVGGMHRLLIGIFPYY